jgi:hypothetical protein
MHLRLRDGSSQIIFRDHCFYINVPCTLDAIDLYSVHYSRAAGKMRPRVSLSVRSIEQGSVSLTTRNPAITIDPVLVVEQLRRSGWCRQTVRGWRCNSKQCAKRQLTPHMWCGRAGDPCVSPATSDSQQVNGEYSKLRPTPPSRGSIRPDNGLGRNGAFGLGWPWICFSPWAGQSASSAPSLGAGARQ